MNYNVVCVYIYYYRNKYGKEWSKEEITLLINAVSKYPGGTVNRWEKIQKVVGYERTVEQIIAKANSFKKKSKHSGKNKNNNNDNNANKWTKEEQKKLETALKSVRNVPKDQKWDKVAEMVATKTKEQCIERFKFIREQLLAKKKKQQQSQQQ